MAKGFQKGNKFGGRKPGARNRITQRVLDNYLFILNLYCTPGKLQADLDDMSPSNRRKAIEGLSKFILPTLTKNENENINSGAIKIMVEYVKKNKDKDAEQ